MELGPCRVVSTSGTSHSSTQSGRGRGNFLGVGAKKVLGRWILNLYRDIGFAMSDVDV